MITNISLVHNNWVLGEHIKLDKCDSCQWLNCSRGATLGNQVINRLIEFMRKNPWKDTYIREGVQKNTFLVVFYY